MARTRVVLRRNGSKVGEVTYASESEAVHHAAKMQGAASGLEALLAPATPVANRKPRRNPSIGRGPRRNGFRDAIGAAMAAYKGVGQAAREAGSATVEAARAGIADAKAAPGRALQRAKDAARLKAEAIAEKAREAKREAEHQRVRQGVNAAIDTIEEYGYVVALKPLTLPTQQSTRLNPSIGRGTKHRDTVAGAVTKRLRAQGVAKKEAVSRGFAIATAAELRHNPTPIDIASLDFGHFKKTVKIAGYYNVRTGRRFARVVSKDGTFVTDVPVADGGKDGSRAKGADAIKRRAYEQLRIHIEPTNWKPSVRVNPSKAGSVAYGGTSIRIHAGTYTVLPHGPSFSGPDGFVGAKKWIDTHGA